MRVGHYLAGLSPDVQDAIVNDLTIGAAWTNLAVRRHRSDPSAAVQLGTIATAYAALRAALDGLDARDGTIATAAASPADHWLPEHWSDLIAAVGADTIGTWLQMAAEMARDAVIAVRRDAAIDAVRDLLRDALDTLTSVRDDALGTA